MPQSATLAFLKEMYSGGKEEYVGTAVEDFQRCGKHTFLATLREVAHLDVRPRLCEVSAPTLVLCGERDRANARNSAEVAAGVPNAELRMIADAGHLWNLERPEPFNRTTEAFVARAVG